MLFNLEKFNKKIQKSILSRWLFTSNLIKKIKEKSVNNLTNTVKDFFHLLSEFGKLKKQKKEMKVILLDD